jgi:hypothetical protein
VWVNPNVAASSHVWTTAILPRGRLLTARSRRLAPAMAAEREILSARER